MLKYCFKIGPAKTCEAMKLARRTLMDNQVFEIEAICMVLILIMVGPFMLLFRSYLWGSMSHAEQIATGGSPERSLFVVWPYFIGLVVGFPLLAMALWYNVFREDQEDIWFITSPIDIEKDTCLVLISGIITVLYITGLLLWDMKLDNSVLVNQNVSGLTCSIPIIIGLVFCTIYPLMHGGHRTDAEDIFWAVPITVGHFVFVVSPPLIFVILLIDQFDNGLEIKLWVYPVVCFGIIFGCGGCIMFLVSVFDGFGDS